MAKKQRQEEDTGTWMNTYSDLVTLLLTFFVLLFSFSSVDADKWEQFVKAVVNSGTDTSQIVLNAEPPFEDGTGPIPMQGQSANGPAPNTVDSTMPADFNDLYRYLQSYVEEQNLTDSVEVMKSGENTVYIRFQNNIFFDPDKAVLRPSSFEILSYLGDCMHSVEDEIYVISINGHTASVDNPETYGVSDWMLSSERASSIAVYFDDQKDIDPRKMRPMGYGKNFPVASNDTAEGREQNRRVDMTIIRGDADMDMDGEMYQELASLFDPSEFPKSGGAKELFDPTGQEPGTAETANPETIGIPAQEDGD